MARRRSVEVLGGILAGALALACSDAGGRDDAAAPGSPPTLPAETSPPADDGSRGATPHEVARAYAKGPAREPESTDWSGGDAAAGRKAFAQHCAICHGGGGSGDGPASTALNPKPRDFTDGTFYIDANANDETGEDVDIARVILEGPGAFGASEQMQGWREAFSDDEIRDLVAYIRTLSNGGSGRG